MARSPITTHVLDTQRGRPAAGVGVLLEGLAQEAREAAWHEMARGTTNGDGRCEDLLTPGSRLAPGTYRLSFATGAYFAAAKQTTFYPLVSVVFEIADPEQHYHVPLLLAAHGYSTYRGS